MEHYTLSNVSNFTLTLPYFHRPIENVKMLIEKSGSGVIRSYQSSSWIRWRNVTRKPRRPRCKSRTHRRRGFILETISWHRLTEDESWWYCSAGRGDTTQIISCRIPIYLPSRLRGAARVRAARCTRVVPRSRVRATAHNHASHARVRASSSVERVHATPRE